MRDRGMQYNDAQNDLGMRDCEHGKFPLTEHWNDGDNAGEIVTTIPLVTSWLKPSMSCRRLRNDDEEGSEDRAEELTEDQSVPPRRRHGRGVCRDVTHLLKLCGQTR